MRIFFALAALVLFATPGFAQDTGSAAVVSIEDHIDETTVRHVRKSFDKARSLGAKTIILKLNTPGGLASAGMELSHFLKQQSDFRVIAFIERKALSAGTMIALAADEIVMQPGASIGDAAPIRVSGSTLEIVGGTERAKMESPILADFRDSAVRNGYDPLLVESMVTLGRTVHWIESRSGDRRFVGPEDFKTLTGQGWAEVAEPGLSRPVDGPDSLLTVHDGNAIRLGLASGTAANAEALAESRRLTIVAQFVPTAGDKVITYLGSAPIRFILMVIFFLSLYAALHAPGHGFAEVLALISLGLLITIPLMNGYARWWEIVIVLVGLGLLALELFVIPGFGVAGITGIMMVLGGLVMTFVGNTGLPGGWKSPSTLAGLQTGLLAVIGGVISSFILAMWLKRFLPKTPYFNRLILAPSLAGSDEPITTVNLDAWPPAGTTGIAYTDLRPGGTGQFASDDGTRLISVVTEGAFVPAGAKIAVLETHGSRVVVRVV